MEFKNKPAIIALYLPQYHNNTENDKWWGKGFTDWVNVKKAKPLFNRHYQPKIIKNSEFYDLLDENVMRNQAKLAAENGVDGFCFYHYWFEGKKILERPIENYRDMMNVETPYCLCWANHSWSRTWGDPSLSEEVLINQTYGNELVWKKHFEYLLTFFKDKKYICIHNKPVLMIYRVQEIPRGEYMLKLWNEMAIENGFDGLFLIQMYTGRGFDQRTELYSAIMDFEPIRTWNSDKFNDYSIDGSGGNLETLKFKNYNAIYEDILSRNYDFYGGKHYMGAFPDWDNTSRKGKWGTVTVGSSSNKFEEYMYNIIKKSKEKDNEFIFINAWNEWAEGAYLEPDEINGYAYLEAIKNAKNRSLNITIEQNKYIENQADNKLNYMYFGDYYSMVVRWLNKEMSGDGIANYIKQAGWEKIAIYGAGKFGIILYKALKNSNIKVKYFIDRNEVNIDMIIDEKIIGLHGINEEESVDAIIVTVPKSFHEVYYALSDVKVRAEIVSLEAIINSL